MNNKQRKYEITFLMVTSLFVTLLNNLPYYSLYFISSDKYKGPELTITEMIYHISWYTLQCFFSVIIIAFLNYFLMKVLFPKILSLVLRYGILVFLNIVLTFLLLMVSLSLSEIIIGFKYGEGFAMKFYVWKYIYLTPLSVLMAYILNLIIRKRIIERKNERLIQENLTSQLKALKDQIKPHFLFNTLNTLSSVIRNDTKESGLNFVDDLAVVYRYILDKSNEDVVKVSVELDFAKSYIRILEKRYGKSLEINVSIESKYEKYSIPPSTFLLLIENALKHNELSKTNALVVNIYIEENYLVVSNNILPKEEKTPGLGIGLQNLSKRYLILTDREIVIKKEKNMFIVRLPMIK